MPDKAQGDRDRSGQGEGPWGSDQGHPTAGAGYPDGAERVDTRWVVLTGPPSSGKTTLLDFLDVDGENVSPDTTRVLISAARAEGRNPLEFRFAPEFQSRVLEAKLTAEQSLLPSERVFLDYALPCSVAFYRAEGRPPTAELLDGVNRFQYQHVFVLDPLPWTADPERLEGAKFQEVVHEHMWDVYRELGYEPVGLPPAPVEARAHTIRRHLDAQG